MSLWLFEIPGANPKLSFGMTGVFRYPVKVLCVFPMTVVRIQIITNKINMLLNKLFDNIIVQGFEK